MGKKTNRRLAASIFLLVFLMGIGYAAVTSSLTINGHVQASAEPVQQEAALCIDNAKTLTNPAGATIKISSGTNKFDISHIGDETGNMMHTYVEIEVYELAVESAELLLTVVNTSDYDWDRVTIGDITTEAGEPFSSLYYGITALRTNSSGIASMDEGLTRGSTMYVKITITANESAIDDLEDKSLAETSFQFRVMGYTN